MQKLSLLLSLFTLFVGAPLWAQQDSSNLEDVPLVTTTQDVGEEQKLVIIAPPQEVKEHYLAILQSLFDLINKKDGVKDLSWLNLPHLSKEIHDVNLLLNTSKEALVGSGTRAGSIYLTEQKTVILNSGLLWEITKDGRNNLPINVGFEVLLLHEFLGALGYPDDNYELSSYLWVRSEPNAFMPILKDMEKALGAHLDFNPRRKENVGFDLNNVTDLEKISSGGSSGFGGGGDPTVALIKHFALGNFSHQKTYWTKYFKLTPKEVEAFPGVLLLAKVEPKKLHASFQENNSLRSQEVFQIIEDKDQIYFVADTDKILNAKAGQEIGMISFEFMAKVLAVHRHLNQLKVDTTDSNERLK